MTEVRAQMGKGPVYLSFDIDALDPAFAPGTGTPEIAGLTPIQVKTSHQPIRQSGFREFQIVQPVVS